MTTLDLIFIIIVCGVGSIWIKLDDILEELKTKNETRTTK